MSCESRVNLCCEVNVFIKSEDMSEEESGSGLWCGLVSMKT